MFMIQTLGLQAADANRRALNLIDLRSRYLKLEGKPRSASLDNWEAFIDDLFVRQSMTARRAERVLGVSFSAAQRAISVLETAGALSEYTGQSRDRVWVTPEISAVLDDGG